MQRLMNFLTVLVVSFLLHAVEFKLVHGRFTKTSCYRSNCVQQDSQGRWCYSPDPRSSTDLTCNGGYGRDASMSEVMAVHLKQGLSIAYYSGVDNALLGGADFPFPASGGIIRICLSGKAGDGTYQTFCENIHEDNDIYGVGGDPFCIVAVGQDNVTDGCYVPESAAVPVNSTSLVVVGPTSQGLPPITVTSTSDDTPITTTVAGNRPTQTVVVDKNGNSSNSTSSTSSPSRIILPVAVSVAGVLFIGAGVGAWFLRKRMRRERELLPSKDPVLEVSVFISTNGLPLFIFFK